MEPAAEHLNLHEDALPFIRSIITGPPQRPALGLVLGSGLSQLAEIMDDAVTIATSDIPGYPESTVEGHEGCLIFGMLEGMPVVFVQGRLHVYEGHSVEESTYPIRLLAGMGVQRLIVTNAAGGIHPECVPGTHSPGMCPGNPHVDHGPYRIRLPKDSCRKIALPETERCGPDTL